jgi:hypothetical protein
MLRVRSFNAYLRCPHVDPSPPARAVRDAMRRRLWRRRFSYAGRSVKPCVRFCAPSGMNLSWTVRGRGGIVMIGELPRTEKFKQQFDWPDALIHVPLGDGANYRKPINSCNM